MGSAYTTRVRLDETLELAGIYLTLSAQAGGMRASSRAVWAAQCALGATSLQSLRSTQIRITSWVRTTHVPVKPNWMR